MGSIDIRREFTQLFLETQKLVNKGDDIPFDIFKKTLFDKINSIHTDIMQFEPTFSLEDHLSKRQREYELTGSMLPPSVYAQLINKKFFTQKELSKLTNSSIQNIAQKAKRGELDIGSIKFDAKIGNSLDELDAVDTYVKALQALTSYLNSKEIKDVDKFKAIESILKYVEPQVINELKRKFHTLNGLANFILQTFIPHVNKRIRELLRSIHEKAQLGEDVSKLQVDIRSVMRDLLPSLPELHKGLLKEGWVMDD